MQEFLTISQLAHGFNVSEKVIRHQFKKLLRQGKLTDGEDFVREGYQDEFHFTYRIHPSKFAALTKMFPTDVPIELFDTQPATTGSQFGTTPQELASESDSQESQPATHVGSQYDERGSNTADTATASDTKESAQGIRDDFLPEYIAAKQEQITLLKEQVADLRSQLVKKDEQSEFKDRLLEDYRHDQNAARDLIRIMGERVVEMSKLSLPSATNVGSRGSNFDSQQNDSGTKSATKPDTLGSHDGSQPDERGSNPPPNDNPWQQGAAADRSAGY